MKNQLGSKNRPMSWDPKIDLCPRGTVHSTTLLIYRNWWVGVGNQPWIENGTKMALVSLFILLLHINLQPIVCCIVHVLILLLTRNFSKCWGPFRKTEYHSIKILSLFERKPIQIKQLRKGLE